MPKPIPELLKYLLEDCLEEDPRFSIRSMFGGYGIYKYGKIFGLYAFDTIYFKVGENNIDDFKERNSKKFTYTKKNGKVDIMSYWELPEDILENRDELNIWIERSLEVVSKTQSRKKSKKDNELDKNILNALLEIPKGKVSTYKILADKFSVHPRRIASVMKYNKEPDIFPCYKIIPESLSVGGYSGPDGIDSKISMLEADGIDIIDGKVNSESIYRFGA